MKGSSLKRKNDKSVPVQESPSKQLKSDVACSKPIVLFNKYTLLDDEQKDRIIYLKPQCVDLLMSKLEQAESSSSETKTQLSYLNENEASLKFVLTKMLQRSLDLLRHDRVESFDSLAAQLKTEYKTETAENIDLNTESVKSISDAYFSQIDSTTSDLVFKTLLRKMLLEDKCLLALDLDKTKVRPYEEVIEFLTGENAASIWSQKFEKKQQQEEATGAKTNANLISAKKEIIELKEKKTESQTAQCLDADEKMKKVKKVDPLFDFSKQSVEIDVRA